MSPNLLYFTLLYFTLLCSIAGYVIKSGWGRVFKFGFLMYFPDIQNEGHLEESGHIEKPEKEGE